MSNDTPDGSTPSDAPDPLGSSDLPPSDAPSSPPPPAPSYGYAPPPPPAPSYGSAAPPPSYGQTQPAPSYAQAPSPGYGQPAYAQLPVAQNGKALWSMILGIVGFFVCGLVCGPVAIVLSRQAKTEIAASGGRQTGDGMAQAGFILGIIQTVLAVVGIVIWIAVIGVGASQGGGR